MPTTKPVKVGDMVGRFFQPFEEKEDICFLNFGEVLTISESSLTFRDSYSSESHWAMLHGVRHYPGGEKVAK